MNKKLHMFIHLSGHRIQLQYNRDCLCADYTFCSLTVPHF